MNPLPPPPSEAIEAYLKMRLNRPGRSRLFASGYEKYGTTLETIGNCTTPLMFEDDSIEGGLYGIAGTGFLDAQCSLRFIKNAANLCLGMIQLFRSRF